MNCINWPNNPNKGPYEVVGKAYESELEKRDWGTLITCDITGNVPEMWKWKKLKKLYLYPNVKGWANKYVVTVKKADL